MTTTDHKLVPDYVRDEMRFYQRGAKRNRWAYICLKVAQLLITSFLTVVTLVPNKIIQSNQSLIVGVFGAILLAIEGIQQAFQLQPLWVKYRATANALKRELMLYQCSAGPYAASQPDEASLSRLFAERAEAIIASENADWTSLQEKVMASHSKQ
jgi:hypothetical protein